MDKIDKLKVLITQFKKQSEELLMEARFARKHNFNIEAQILGEKVSLVDSLILQLKMKIIDESLEL